MIERWILRERERDEDRERESKKEREKFERKSCSFIGLVNESIIKKWMLGQIKKQGETERRKGERKTSREEELNILVLHLTAGWEKEKYR